MQAHQEELVGSNDDHHQAMIMKRKRSKRPRPSVTSSSSSDSTGNGVAAEFNSVSSPTTSGLIYEGTEEEEDMANCLIMLAQSDGPKRKFDEVEFKVEKFRSRKFSEISTTKNKAGIFVYECKTCNRSFSSFQALGGHMTSHKKPKAAASTAAAVVADDKKPIVLAVKDHILALQVSNYNKANCHGNIKGNKIHECSICGSEFSSGQALGGHMRRHRAAATAVVAVAAGAVSVDTSDIKPRNIPSLDLNLPAPEDDLRDSKFQLVFSTPALVNCHY